jgi:hypothetical protein
MVAPADNLMQACVENRRKAGVPLDRWADVVRLDVGGVAVHVRALTAVELARWYGWFKGAAPADRRRLLPAVMFAASVCDERGRRLFDVGDAERIASEFDPRVLARVTTHAMQINGMTE